jgi:hypothetical protein
VLLEQNDYSLGKMIQVIGRNLKILLMTQEEKVLCDRLFFSTDKRRFMTYNDYQAIDGKNVFVSVGEDLSEIVKNCTPYSVIILSEGEYNADLDFCVEGTKITSKENAKINGEIKISANNVCFENVSIKSNETTVESENPIITSTIFSKVDIDSCIKIKSKVNGFTIKDSIVYGCDCAITFLEEADNVLIGNNIIKGTIEFKDSLTNSYLLNNAISAVNGIILNGECDENIVIEGNLFNME